MSRSIDERIVEMRFDNKQFESGIKESMQSLNKLEDALNNNISSESLDNISRAAENIDVSGLNRAIETINSRFSTLGIIGTTAIVKLANTIINTLGGAIKSVTDSIISGGLKRAMNIENAHFQLQGIINDEKEVDAVMKQANESVDGTAYSYDVAAKAASMFAATGIKSGEGMENALKGIAGVAATTNSDYESMAQIFTKVAGNGRLMGDELLQLSSHGMNAAAALANYFNNVNDGSVKATDSVKNAIQQLTGATELSQSSSEARVASIEREYEAASESFEQEYKIRQDTFNKEYKALQKNLDNEYNLKKAAYDQEYKELQKSLDKEYKALQETLRSEYNAQKEQFNNDYKDLQKSLDKEYKIKKEAYDKEYKELQESLDAEIKAQKKANEARVKEAEAAYKEDVSNYKKASEEKIALIDAEYAESLKLIDKEAYDKMKAIDDQIQGIEDAAAAEEKAKKEIERVTKLTELSKAVAAAEAVEERTKAEAALVAYQKKLAEEDLAESRKAQIAKLKEEKAAIKETADIKKQEAKEKRNAAVTSVQEESNATLSAMADKHAAELESLKESLNAQLEEMQDSRDERLETLKSNQTEELEAVRENQQGQLEQLKSSQESQLNALQTSQNAQLETVKESQSAQLESLRSNQSAELSAMKESQSAQLEAYKESQSAQLEALKKANTAKLKEMKKAADEQTKALTGFSSSAKVTEADIREMVSKGLISFDIFSEAMATTFGDHAKDANKTFLGSLANIKAALSRTGALFISPLIEQDGEFVKFFNVIREKINEFNGILGSSGGIAERFTDKVKDTVKTLTFFIEKIDLSGESVSNAFSNIGTIIGNTFDGLMTISKIIGESFEDVFGKGSIIKGVQNLILSIRDLTEYFKFSEKNAEDLKKGFTGIFDIAKLILDIFSQLIGSTISYSSSTESLGDNILSLVGYIGSVLSKFAKLVESSNSVTTAIKAIGTAIKFIKDSFAKVINNIAESLSSFKGVKIDFSKMFIFGDVANKTSTLSIRLKNILDVIWDGTKRVLEPLAPVLKNVKDSIVKLVKSFDPLKTLLYLLNGVLITDLINNMRNLGSLLRDTTSEPLFVIKRLKGSLTELQNALKAFTLAINAGALKDIAISVGILAGSIFILSSIEPGPLASALGAVSTVLGELVGTLTLINKLNSSMTLKGGILGILDAVKMSIITNQLIKMAVAALLLSIAVKTLASLSWEELIKGLTGMTVILAELVGVVIILEKTGGDKKLASVGTGLLLMSAAVIILTQAVKQLSSLDIESIAKGLIAIGGLLLELAIFTELTGGSEKMISIGLGMILVSSAVIILAQAVKQLSDLDWEGIGKGLAAVGGLLFELGLFTKLTGGSTNMIAISVGMVILSAALKSLSDVLIELSALSWEEIAKGLAAIGGTLLEVTLALNGMPNTAILKAAGLVVLAAGLKIIGEVVTELAKLSWEEIAKGLVAMGGALLELGIALNAIPPWAILGAAGLAVTAVGLKSIAESMQQFGGMSWEEIAKGLVAMGGALAELVIALKLVNGNLVGAVSLTIVALAISNILPMFIQLGNMKWEEIGKACTAMAAALGILAGAIAILSAIGPAGLIGAASLLAFGVALGVAVAAVSASIGLLVGSIRKMDGINANQFLKNAEVLALAIGAIGLALKTFGVTSPIGASAMKTVAEGLLILYPAILGFSMIDGSKISATFIRLATGIAEFGLSLKTFGPLSNIGATAFNTIAEAISKLAPAMVIFMALDLDKVSQVLKTLGESFKVFGESLESFGLLSPLGADAMSICADAVSKLAPALFLLKEIEPDVLAVTLHTLADAFKGFGEALDSAPFWFAKTRAEGIGALIDNIPKLVEVLPAFMDLDPEGTRFALETLADAFCAFGEALNNAPFWSPQERGEAIGVLVQEISTLAEVLPAFMELNPEGTKNALDTIGSAFNTFGNALNNAPFWGVTDKGNAIKVLVDSIGTLADGLRDFLTLDSTSVDTALKQIHTAFTDFANALDQAPFWGVTDKGNAIKVLVDSVDILADGLRNFLTLDSDKVSNALNQIKKAFTNFANALDQAPFWGVADRGNAIKTLVESLDILVPAIKSLTEIGADDVNTIMSAIGQGFVDFGKSLKESPFWGTQKRSDAIVSLVDSLDSLTDSVIKMSSLSYEQMVQILGAMSGGIKQCADALKQFDKNASNNTTVMSNLVTTVTGLSNINAPNLQSVIIELGKLSDKVLELTKIDSSKLDDFVNSLNKFIKDLAKAIDSNTVRSFNKLSTTFVLNGIINPMSNVLTNNTQSVIKRVSIIISQIRNTAVNDRTVQKAFYDLSTRTTTQYIKGIKDKTNSVITVITTLLNKIISAIKGKNSTYKTLGLDHAKYYVDAIKSYKGSAETAGKQVGAATVTGIESKEANFKKAAKPLVKAFADGLTEQADSNTINKAAKALVKAVTNAINDYEDEFKKSGKNAADGFAKGLKDKVDDVADEARKLAQEAQNTINNELGIESPSRVLRESGRYTGEGFALGLIDRIKAVKAAAVSLSQASVDVFDDAADSVSDIVEDLDPVITPIVDLTNVMEAASDINDLFSNAVAAVGSRVSDASSSMIRRQTNNQQNIQNGEDTSGTNVTFIQNNNSPKALSRIDIYRQTRNQLAQFREAIERT